MTTILRWSPTRQFHYHHDLDALLPRFFNGATDETAQRAPAWLPAAEGRIDDGTYVIQLAMPGVDPKDVQVSWMNNVLTVKGERKADHDTTGRDYFVRELAYGAYTGDAEHPDRPIVNAPIGDRDRSEATLAGRSAVELALLSP